MYRDILVMKTSADEKHASKWAFNTHTTFCTKQVTKEELLLNLICTLVTDQE